VRRFGRIVVQLPALKLAACSRVTGSRKSPQQILFAPLFPVGQSLEPTGMTVITQLSSFFLVCIGVQIAWNGVKPLLQSVTLHFG
jgi:hypothetical protein